MNILQSGWAKLVPLNESTSSIVGYVTPVTITIGPHLYAGRDIVALAGETLDQGHIEQIVRANRQGVQVQGNQTRDANPNFTAKQKAVLDNAQRVFTNAGLDVWVAANDKGKLPPVFVKQDEKFGKAIMSADPDTRTMTPSEFDALSDEMDRYYR